MIIIQMLFVVIPSHCGIRVFIDLTYFEETDLNFCLKADTTLEVKFQFANLLHKSEGIVIGFPRPWGFAVFQWFTGVCGGDWFWH